MPDLPDQKIATVTAEGAFDTRKCHDTIAARGAAAIIPPRKPATAEDLKTGPTEPRSTILTEAEEAAIVAFWRHRLLPLDDCLYALQPQSPS